MLHTSSVQIGLQACKPQWQRPPLPRKLCVARGALLNSMDARLSLAKQQALSYSLRRDRCQDGLPPVCNENMELLVGPPAWLSVAVSLPVARGRGSDFIHDSYFTAFQALACRTGPMQRHGLSMPCLLHAEDARTQLHGLRTLPTPTGSFYIKK